MDTTLMTADELIELPELDKVYELVRGHLKVMELPGGLHGRIGMRLSFLLMQHVIAQRLGTVLPQDTGYILARNPDTVRAPDVSFLSRERVAPNEIGAGYIEGAPDLAVEVLSPGDRMSEVEEKIDEYFGAGGRLAWVVDPKRARVSVYAPGRTPVVLGEDDTLEGDDVVPGFRCLVREVLTWPE